MQELITSFLIQSRHCKLKDIGNFTLLHSPAKSDIANKKIVSSHVEIIFSPKEEKLSEDLVQYIARNKNISIGEAQEDLQQWCAETDKKLKNGEEVFFKPLGFLKKSQSGIDFFQNINLTRFFEPVPAERVIRKNSEHQMLVGDKEVTSTTMSHFYQSEEIITQKKWWKLIAIILLVGGLVFLFFYFNKHSFSISATGNQAAVNSQAPPSTYTSH